MFMKQFPRHRRKSKRYTEMVKRDIRSMVLAIESDLEKLKGQYAKMINAVEYSIYEKLIGIALKSRALERFIIDSKISSDEVIIFDDGTLNLRKVCINTLRQVSSMSWDLPTKYTDVIREILYDKERIHKSKIKKYMPTNKPHNLLDDLYNKLSSAPMYFREEVCQSCGWSVNTFFNRKANRVRLQRKRVLDHPFTEAEAEKIISIFKKVIIPALWHTCQTWEQDLRTQRNEAALNENMEE